MGIIEKIADVYLKPNGLNINDVKSFTIIKTFSKGSLESYDYNDYSIVLTFKDKCAFRVPKSIADSNIEEVEVELQNYCDEKDIELITLRKNLN